MINKTLAIIKPESVKNGQTGEILDLIIKAGFRISALKMYHLTVDQAKLFYAVHTNKPFFDALVTYMSSGPVIITLLDKENAVEDFRKLIGNTDPSLADEGTIRKKYGTDNTRNAIHGSDSDLNAETECSWFFSKFSIF